MWVQCSGRCSHQSSLQYLNIGVVKLSYSGDFTTSGPVLCSINNLNDITFIWTNVPDVWLDCYVIQHCCQCRIIPWWPHQDCRQLRPRDEAAAGGREWNWDVAHGGSSLDSPFSSTQSWLTSASVSLLFIFVSFQSLISGIFVSMPGLISFVYCPSSQNGFQEWQTSH